MRERQQNTINRQILRLAIPNIISNLSVPLLSSADTAILGHLDQVYYLGALAIGGVIFNFIYWGFGFLRMGTTGLTAQAHGTGNDRDAHLILARTLLIALTGGILLIALQAFIAGTSFALINATPEVEKYALEYFYIRIYAAPATLLLYAFHGWFLGMQNAKYPLVLTVLANVINIVLNFAFVFGLGMKADGVAWATVIAQYSGLLLAVILYLRKYGRYTLQDIRQELFAGSAFKRIFQVNIDIFVRTLALIFTFSYFTVKSAEGGDTILAVNSILLQLIGLLAYGVDGFAFSAESLVGKYIGAQDRGSLKKTVTYSFRWGIGLGVVFAIAFSTFGEPLLRVFTDKKDVIAQCLVYMPWVAVAPLINSWCFIWDGIFIGATATKPMRNSMLFCTVLVFLPVYFLLKDALGNHSLWLALTVFMVMRGVTLTLYARKYIL